MNQKIKFNPFLQGNLQFEEENGGTGTPAAPDTSIQFNDNGAFGGSADLEWDGSQLILGGGKYIQFNDDASGHYTQIAVQDAQNPGDGTELDIFAGKSNGNSTNGGDVWVYGNFGKDSVGTPTGAATFIARGGRATSDGGNAEISGGAGRNDGNGGDIILKPGDYPGGSGRRGRIQIPVDNNWGGTEIQIQDQTTPDTDGNYLTIQSGKALGSGVGGDLALNAGRADTSGKGGSIYLLAGQGGGTGDGGDIHLIPGSTFSGMEGHIFIQDNVTDISAILDTSLLSSSDKTFSFPNQTGNFQIAGVTAFASGTTLNSSLSGATVTNTGASGLAVFNLPASSVGLMYTFVITDADGLEIVANGTDLLYIGDAVSTAGGNIQATAVGNSITIQCVASGMWATVASAGVWSLN